MKRQVNVPGGLRKVIQTGGPTSSPGTTIAELGATTVSLAQLKALLGITTPAAGSSSNSGSSTAAILTGAGLLGGGPVIGAVPLYLAQSTPPVIWNDDLLPDNFVGGAGSSGSAGIIVTDGTNTVTGASKVTFSGATVGGATPNATVSIAGGGGGMTLIGKSTAASAVASLTVSSIPNTYTCLQIVTFAQSTAAAAAVDLHMQFNGDTGSNYDSQYIQGFGTSTSAAEAIGQTWCIVGSITASTGPTTRPGGSSSIIPGYTSTVLDKAGTGTYNTTFATGSGGNVTHANMYVWRPATPAAITSVTIFAATGNLVTGSFLAVYGIP